MRQYSFALGCLFNGIVAAFFLAVAVGTNTLGGTVSACALAALAVFNIYACTAAGTK